MPPEFRFEPRSPRYGLFLVLGLVDTSCAQSRPFEAIFWPFLGHTMQVHGNKGLVCHKEVKVHMQCGKCGKCFLSFGRAL